MHILICNKSLKAANHTSIAYWAYLFLILCSSLVLSMARNFIYVTSILACLVTLAISPAQFVAQTTVPSQNTEYYSPPPPYATPAVCPYPCRPPPIPTTTICPPPPPYLPQLPPPPQPSFYPSPGGYVPNVPPFWNYVPPPPNPILPYFPWYYKYPPPPPDYSPATSPTGIPMAMIPCIIMVVLFTSWF